MSSPSATPRQQYLDWVDDQIEEFKAALTREDLLDVAEEAVSRLQSHPDGQYTLTELMLCDAVDALIFEKLNLPDYRGWRRACRNDTEERPPEETTDSLRVAS